MHDFLLILRREFGERVRSRSYLLGTLLFPAFMAGIIVLPSLADRGGTERRQLAVVDQAPTGVADRLVHALAILGADDGDAAQRYTVEVVRAPIESVRDELNRRVLDGDLDGYLVLPPDVLEVNEVHYRSQSIPGPALQRELQDALSQAAAGERLRAAGLDLGEVATLTRRVRLQAARLDAAGVERGNATGTIIVAYILAFLIYLLTAIYGMAVLRSVLEEKTNRIAEVLVSSMRATHLMAGKIVGVGSAALLQVVAWAVVLALLVSQSSFFAERLGIPAGALQAVSINPGTGALLLAFFVFGFFLFASLFAALGAAVTTDQEAQSFQMVLMVPLFVPLLFLIPITTDPLGRLASTLGMIPFTAPIAMPMRLASAPIPPLEVATSLGLLVLTMALVTWVAGKIYRIGILSTGKRPTLAELGRWIRTA